MDWVTLNLDAVSWGVLVVMIDYALRFVRPL